jgi:hypothetical protein
MKPAWVSFCGNLDTNPNYREILSKYLIFVLQLSGEVRRRIGLKVLELGGNAVIGYKQYFDLEGESGIVVRVRHVPYLSSCFLR